MLVAVAVAIIVVGMAVAWWRRRHHPVPDATGRAELSGLDPDDVAELDRRFETVRDEDRRLQQALLRVRVEPLVERQVPVRAVEPLPELRTVRVRFADGTTVVANGEIAGDAGRLAMVIRYHHVVACSCTTAPEGMRVVFGWSGERHHLAMRVSGLDQPA